MDRRTDGIEALGEPGHVARSSAQTEVPKWGQESVTGNREAGSGAADIVVRMESLTDREALSNRWKELETRANATFFTSWSWVGNWLEQLPEGIEPLVLIAEASGRVVGLALFVERKVARHFFLVSSRSLFLQETGLPEYDRLTLEYSSLLLDAEIEQEVAARCIEFLAREVPQWEEMVIDWIDARNPVLNPELLAQCGLRLQVRAKLPSWYVDLNAIRQANTGYLASLSNNTRYQVRRSLRECERHGQIRMTQAQTVGQAGEFYEQIKRLHQDHWASRGLPGAFSSGFFVRFHQSLIRSRFEHGEIELIEVAVGDAVLGYIYNFVQNRRVYFYQSGFNYQLGAKIRPGYVCHYLAIEQHLQSGTASYDFLASNCRYKQSLSTNANDLVAVTIQRDLAKFRVEDRLRAFARKPMFRWLLRARQSRWYDGLDD